MSSCPSCGVENRPTARFCHQCGQLLVPIAELLEATENPVELPAETKGHPATDEPEVVAGRAGEVPGGDTSEVVGSVSSAEEADFDELGPPNEDMSTAEVSERSAMVVSAVTEDVGDVSIPVADEPNEVIEDADGVAFPANDIRLEIGAIVAGRFAVQEIATQEDGRVRYRVEDRGICPACLALIHPSEEEPYCFECGAYVMSPDLPRPQRVLVLAADSNPDTGETIAADGRRFLLLAETPPAAADESYPTGDSFPRGVHLLSGQRSDVGLARADRPDEDSVFALTMSAIYESRAVPTLGLYFVADGMGGHGDGEIASRLVAETVCNVLLQSLIAPALYGKQLPVETIEALLDSAVQLGNRLVRQEATRCGNDMGSTLTLAFVHNEHVFVVNVGDSRTYLRRNGVLQQLTADHSAVFQLFRVGTIREEEIYTHPRRNEITRNMGFRQTVQPDFFQIDLLPGDTLLLCCDGLWEMLHNDGIADVFLTSYGDPQQICDELIRRANQAGGDDNISAIVVRAQA